MDQCKKGKEKRLKLHTPVKSLPVDDSKESTPTETQISCPYDSPDFMLGTQETFHVSWDWRAQVNRDHGVRIASPVNRVHLKRHHPKRHKSSGSEQKAPPACLRPRRLLVTQDVNIHDVSHFKAELQALAAGQKKSTKDSVSLLYSDQLSKSDLDVQETVADVPVVPTSSSLSQNYLQAYAGTTKPQENVSSESKGSVHFQNITSTDKNSISSVKSKENLTDLFDDSLSDDLIKCSQVMDNPGDARTIHSPVKTPATFKMRKGSTSKKKRLSLTVSKTPDLVTTSRKSLSHKFCSNAEKGGSSSSETSFTSKGTGITKDNQCEVTEDRNNNGLSDILDAFDDFDDAALLSVAAVEEFEFCHKPVNKKTADVNSFPQKDKYNHANSCEVMKEDGWTSSPDAWNIIDYHERKALEKQSSTTSTSKPLMVVPQKKYAHVPSSSLAKVSSYPSSCSATSRTHELKIPVDVAQKSIAKETLDSGKALEKQPCNKSTSIPGTVAPQKKHATTVASCPSSSSTATKVASYTSSCSATSRTHELKIPVDFRQKSITVETLESDLSDNMEGDFSVPPDAWSIIDSSEKKALEEQPSKTATSVPPVLAPQRKEAVAALQIQKKVTTPSSSSCSTTSSTMQRSNLHANMKQQQVVTKTLESCKPCVSAPLNAPRTQCTPEEIEQKRLDAIQKRRNRLRLKT